MECPMNKYELAAQLRTLEQRQHQLLAMLRDFIDDSEFIQGSTFALPRMTRSRIPATTLPL